MREIIIENCDDEDLLKAFFEDEDDEELRFRLASRLSDQDFLLRLALEDYNLDVRHAATTRIKDEGYLV